MLKEGLIVDPANHERIAKLLRFASSRSDDPQARVSFDDYIARMPESQKQIYYLAGARFRFDRQEPEPRDLPPPGHRSACSSPIRSTNSRITRWGRIAEEAHFDRLGRHRDSRDGPTGETEPKHGELRRQGERLPQSARPLPRSARDRG